jgi:ATP-dependent DNA helicase
MSSEPVASAETTPPTSPETRNNGLTEAMQKEEEQMAKAREKEDAKHERKLAAERKKDMKEGSGALDAKYKALEYLLSQSKLYSTIMLQQMTQQEDAETAKDEKSKQRAVKREEKAEQAAVASQKRSTRRGATKTWTRTPSEKCEDREIRQDFRLSQERRSRGQSWSSLDLRSLGRGIKGRCETQ